MTERPSVTSVQFVSTKATLHVGLAHVAGPWHRRVVAVVRIPWRAHFFLSLSLSHKGGKLKVSVIGKKMAKIWCEDEKDRTSDNTHCVNKTVAMSEGCSEPCAKYVLVYIATSYRHLNDHIILFLDEFVLQFILKSQLKSYEQRCKC